MWHVLSKLYKKHQLSSQGKQHHRISEEFGHLVRLCQQQQSSSASTGYWRITSKRSLKHVQLHQASPILVAQLQSTSPKKCLCLFNKGIRKARSKFRCGLWMIQRCLNDMSFTKIFDLIIINKPFSRILQERPTSNAYHNCHGPNMSKPGMGPCMTLPIFLKKSGE